jgi:hypothetical protein
MQVLVLNPVFMKYVHETWLDYQGKYPSTGFMALILSLHICDKVRPIEIYRYNNTTSWHNAEETHTNAQ